MSIKYTKTILNFFCTVLCFLGMQELVFATDKAPSTRTVDFKTIEEVNIGIANQLEFLIDYNKTNEAENKSHKNWYVYIVGDDTFNTDLFSGYVEDQLDLTDIGIGNTPIKIEDLNKKLVEVNEKLSKDPTKPLIYYGVANKKTAIPAPYFPFEDFFDKSSATAKEILEYYDNILGLTKSKSTKKSSDNTAKLLKQFYDNEIDKSILELLTKTLEKAGQNGAVALSKYYYAFIKEKKGEDTGKANISWWSRKKYTLSKKYFDKNPVDKEKLKAHKRYLSGTDEKNNFRTVNAWLNYLTNAEIPESEFLKGLLNDLINNSACNNLSITEGEKQKNEFITAINSGDTDKTVKAVKSLCSSVIKKTGYKNIIQAIKNIAKKTISEEAEVAVLYLMHNIEDKDYEEFFKDLKDPKEDLLMTLLVQIDDDSVNPFDGENYTSFIGQLLYISYQNNAKHLKKERAYLLETLLLSFDKFDWAKGSVEKAIAKVITFNLGTDEKAFFDYLKANNYKSLLHVLKELSKEVIYNDELYAVADKLGDFFANLDNEEVYLELLDIIFHQKSIDSTGIYIDPEGLMRLKGFMAEMFNTVPEKSTKLYSYFKFQEFERLKNILVSIDDSKGFYGKNIEDLYNKFFNGVLKILDKDKSVSERIALAKWAIESDKELLNFKDVQENLILNILKNINTVANKQEVYKFLNDDEQEYFKKCTADGVLSSEGRMSEFIIDFVKLINKVGEVKDRMAVLKYAIAKGDDSIFYNDTESLVSYVFSEIKDFNDAKYLIDELKGKNGDYKLFAQVWSILKESGIFEWFNTDNQYATNFITQISGIMKIAYGDPKKDLSKTVKDLMKKNYLDVKVGKIPTINIDKDRFFPMARSGALSDDVGNTANDYEYEANIVLSENTVNVVVKLTIVDRDGEEKVVVDTKTLKPLDFVTVQFIADTEINSQTTFKKGDIIAVPAMYLAWMDNLIDGAQNAVIARVTMDGVVIVFSAAVFLPTGGASAALGAKLLAGAEIIFATTDAIIAINEKELKEVLGANFVEGVETANLAFGIATLPAAVPGLITITSKAQKVIKSGANTGFKAAVDGLSTLKGYKFKIDGDLLLQSLKNLKADAPDVFKTQMDLARNLLAKQKMKLDGIPASGKQAAQKFYNQALKYTTTFYLHNTPKLATVVNKFPKKFQRQIVNGLLVLKFEGKTFCKIDSEGFLQRIDIYSKADNYKPIPGLEDGIPVQIKVNDKVYDEVVVIVKDYKGSPIFRPQYKEGVKRIGDLINELHIRSANSPPYMNGTKVTDYTIPVKERFYVVEYKTQGIPGGFGSNRLITSVEELRKELAVLEGWKDPTQNGGLVIRQYEAIQPIQTRSGTIGSQKEISGVNAGQNYPGGGHQYEFLENWRANDHKKFMKQVKETRLINNAGGGLIVNHIDDFLKLTKLQKIDYLKDAWKAYYPQVFFERRLFENMMGSNRYLKSLGWGHTDDIAHNFKAIDFYNDFTKVGDDIFASTAVSMKTTTTKNVDNWLASNLIKKNLDNLEDGMSTGNGITWNGSTIKYSKAEVHIYMPKANLTPELKTEWLNKLVTERPNIKFKINTLEDFIK